MRSICVGGPLHGAHVNCKPGTQAMFSALKPIEWESAYEIDPGTIDGAKARTILKTSYSIKRIIYEVASISVYGEAYVWNEIKSESETQRAVIAMLIAEAMTY